MKLAVPAAVRITEREPSPLVARALDFCARNPQLEATYHERMRQLSAERRARVLATIERRTGRKFA